jgi:hypothetical protein
MADNPLFAGSNPARGPCSSPGRSGNFRQGFKPAQPKPHTSTFGCGRSSRRALIFLPSYGKFRSSLLLSVNFLLMMGVAQIMRSSFA